MSRNSIYRRCKAQTNREYCQYDFKNKLENAYINGVNISIIRSAIMAAPIPDSEKNSLLKEYDEKYNRGN